MPFPRSSAAAGVCLLASIASAQVPKLDSLAGKWLSGPEVVFPPSVTATMGALGCMNNLTGFHYCNFPPIAQGGDAAQLYVDGKPLDARRFRWFPYQAMREATVNNGLKFTSTTRLAADKPLVLIRLHVENTADKALSARLELRNDTGFRRCPGVWDWNNRGVDPADGFRHRLSPSDEEIADSNGDVRATITCLPQDAVTFKPHESRTFDIQCSLVGPTASFQKEFDGAMKEWERRWHDAFTPGNQTYSGSLPTLVTTNAKLKRVYYLSVATFLGLERTSFPHSKRCFVTVGPRWGTTLEYFWDVGLFATVYSLLDPVNMRANLNAWLNIDIHNHYAIDYLTGEGVGPWYAPNDFSVFTSFWKYGEATGDAHFMAENRERFVQWAEAWKVLVRPGEKLADFGENYNLLECSPAYVNMIPSLNAAHVGIMRKAALLTTGEEAKRLRQEADGLAAAVLAQYVPGDGVWKTKHRDGTEVANRHVYDYLTIGLSMTESLTPTMKREMTAFVNRELLAEGWIRAMSLSDPNAAISDRPDHGPKGSYAAWPALAALTMAKFRQYRDMENMFERCEGACWQGPFPQGFELLRVPGTTRWIPRIAIRNCDYNETSGTTFAEAVICGLFGTEFGLNGEVSIADAQVARPIEAALLNLRTKAGLRNYLCGSFGVRRMR